MKVTFFFDLFNVLKILTAPLCFCSLIFSSAGAMTFPDGAHGINVRDHGVKGDGITDDTRAINDVFSARGNHGKIFYFPDGPYMALVSQI